MSVYLCPRHGCGFGVAGEAGPDDWDEPDPILEHEDEHRREDEAAGVPSPQRWIDMAGNVTVAAPADVLASIEATRVPRPAGRPRHRAPVASTAARAAEVRAMNFCDVPENRRRAHLADGAA